MLDRIWGTFLYRVLQGRLEMEPNNIIERFCEVVLHPLQKIPEGPKLSL